MINVASPAATPTCRSTSTQNVLSAVSVTVTVFVFSIICGVPLTACQRMMNGFGTSFAVEIHTLLVCRYSLIISWPLSRPSPLLL